MSYPHTLYTAEVEAGPPTGQLEKHLQADVCIIGAGLAGITTALELARRGLAVMVLEAERIGWGASGRNGGLVSAGFSLEAEKIYATAGKDDAWSLFGLSLSGAQYVRKQLERLKMKEVLQGQGSYLVSRREAGEELKNHANFCQQNLGYTLKYCDTDKVRAVLDTKRYHQALFDKDALHIQPLKYTLELALEFEQLGGLIFEQTRALSIKKHRIGWHVSTRKGSVSADHVVLCTSAYDLSIYRPAVRAVLPVTTYMVATHPDGEMLDAAIKTSAFVSDTRRAGDYYRRLPGGRLIWGERISTMTRESEPIGEHLLRDVYSAYLQLGTLRAAYVWSGQMGYSRHKMPLIAQMKPGLWVATAFGGRGLNTTAMAGQLLGRAIGEGDDQYRLFERWGFKGVGGPFRRLVAQAGYRAMQARDKLEEMPQGIL